LGVRRLTLRNSLQEFINEHSVAPSSIVV
jgi:hypothetical protein